MTILQRKELIKFWIRIYEF